MIKQYQEVVDADRGDCLRACVCSLLNLSISEIPNYFDAPNFHEAFMKSLSDNGYSLITHLWNPNNWYLTHPNGSCFEENRYIKEYSLEALGSYQGVDGYFIGAVISPNNFSWGLGPLDHTHAVIIDKDFDIVHDPNPNYKDIIRYPFSRELGYNGVYVVYVIEKL